MLQEVGMPNQHDYLWKTEVNNVSLKGKKEGNTRKREGRKLFLIWFKEKPFYRCGTHTLETALWIKRIRRCDLVGGSVPL